MQVKNYNIDTSGMSIRQLKSFFATAAKAANDRIRTLTKEEHIESAQAYKYHVEPLRGAGYIKTRADAKTGREMTVFTQPKAPGKNASAAEQKAYGAKLREAVTHVKRFLSAKTSTVSGIKELDAERRSQLDTMINAKRQGVGDYSNTGTGLSDADKESILRWMGSPEGQAAMQDFDSHQVREAVTIATMADRKGDGTTSIETLYNDFKDTQQTLADWINSSEEALAEMKEM